MKRTRFITVVAILLTGFSTSLATTYYEGPQDSLWGEGAEAVRGGRRMRGIPSPRRDLDNYLGQFQLIARFLTQMQEQNPNNDQFGGIHEGEGDQLWGIVETDNTQEAIVVWSLYADHFRDEERFQDNIEAAWEYCHRYPAWEEAAEGHYYALHNAGWGLMAEMFYRRVYGDDERDYGNQCAQYLFQFTPQQVPAGDLLMPLVMGWSAGTLYLYGVEQNNEEWVGRAREVAQTVKNWIDERPERLNNNEIWALCGGTAMWGILTALGTEEPENLRHWGEERLPRMDIFAGRGNWNNSWNIWYAHAWEKAYRLWGNEEYLENAIAIIDSLIAQDNDGDGGIPATIGDPPSRDQSWVSAYTAWMGLFNNFPRLPEVDLRPLAILSPNPLRPIGTYIPYHFQFLLVQQGSSPRVDSVTISLINRDLNRQIFTVQTSLEGWLPVEWEWEEEWIAEQMGHPTFDLVTSHPQDHRADNDTLTFSLEVLPTTLAVFTIRNMERRPFSAALEIFHLPYDSLTPLHQLHLTSDQPDTVRLVRGRYKLNLKPTYPYPHRTIEELVVEEEVQSIDLLFTIPPILLVNNDPRNRYGQYYEDALKRLGYEWTSLRGEDYPAPETPFPILIFFTGDGYENLISPEQKESLTEFLAKGGKLFLSGQNIAQGLQNDPFLSEVLKVRYLTGSVGTWMMEGTPGDPILGGRQALVLGNLGANNQTSPDGIAPENGALMVARWRNRGDTASATRWEDGESGAKVLFFSFGFEAISGQGGTATRDQIMSAILNWFEVPQSATSPVTSPSAHTLSVFPNPFNSGLTIEIGDHFNSFTDGIIEIYDQVGRKIWTYNWSGEPKVLWTTQFLEGGNMASGPYFITFKSRGRSIASQPILLLR